MNKKIKVELYAYERDFIAELLQYVLFDEMIDKLSNAKPNRENIITLSLNSSDLEQLIGNLSFEANHNKKRSIQESAYELAEKLESYESRK